MLIGFSFWFRVVGGLRIWEDEVVEIEWVIFFPAVSYCGQWDGSWIRFDGAGRLGCGRWLNYLLAVRFVRGCLIVDLERI